jgi:hypothetical protein
LADAPFFAFFALMDGQIYSKVFILEYCLVQGYSCCLGFFFFLE